MFSDTFLHVPVACITMTHLCKYTEPYTLKKDIQVDFFFSLFLPPVLISQRCGYRESRFSWEAADS